MKRIIFAIIVTLIASATEPVNAASLDSLSDT